MKKMYNKPEFEIFEMVPQGLICTSTQFGGKTENLQGSELHGA